MLSRIYKPSPSSSGRLLFASTHPPVFEAPQLQALTLTCPHSDTDTFVVHFELKSVLLVIVIYIKFSVKINCQIVARDGRGHKMQKCALHMSTF